jgi:hypothetical protein
MILEMSLVIFPVAAPRRRT